MVTVKISNIETIETKVVFQFDFNDDGDVWTISYGVELHTFKDLTNNEIKQRFKALMKNLVKGRREGLTEIDENGVWKRITDFIDKEFTFEV